MPSINKEEVGECPTLSESPRSFPPHVARFLASLAPEDGLTPTFESCEKCPMILTPTEKAIFATVRAVCERFHIQHAKPRVAGGWVRDKILGLPSDDIDIAVEHMSGVTFARFVERYHQELTEREAALRSEGNPSAESSPAKDAPNMSRVGVIKSNPAKSKHLSTATFLLHGLSIDCSNMRTEVYRNDSRIPLVQMGSPRDDVMRRDFTLNSLFYNILTDQVEDACGTGVQDLLRGLLRAPLPAFKTFSDDPLRVLRAMRLAARFQFDVATEIESAAAHPTVHKSVLRKISRERVGKEIGKMLNDFRSVSTAFAFLCRWGLRPVLFASPEPELLCPSVAAAANAVAAPCAAAPANGKKDKKAAAAAGAAQASGSAGSEAYCPVTMDPALAAEFPMFQSPEVVHRLVVSALAPLALEKLARMSDPAPAPDAATAARAPAPGCATGGVVTRLMPCNLSEDTLLTSYCWSLMDYLQTLFTQRYPRTFSSFRPAHEDALTRFRSGMGARRGLVDLDDLDAAYVGDDIDEVENLESSFFHPGGDSDLIVSLPRTPAPSCEPTVVTSTAAVAPLPAPIPGAESSAVAVLAALTAPLRPRQRVFLSSGLVCPPRTPWQDTSDAEEAVAMSAGIPLWAVLPAESEGGGAQRAEALRLLEQHAHAAVAEAAVPAAAAAQAPGAGEWAPSKHSLSMALLSAFLFPFFGRRIRAPRGRFIPLVSHFVMTSLKLSNADDAAVATIQLAAHRLRALAAEYSRLGRYAAAHTRVDDVVTASEAVTRTDWASTYVTMACFQDASFAASVSAWRVKLCAAVAAAGPHLDAALALAEAVASVSEGPVAYVAPARKYRGPEGSTEVAAEGCPAACPAAGGHAASSSTAPLASAGPSAASEETKKHDRFTSSLEAAQNAVALACEAKNCVDIAVETAESFNTAYETAEGEAHLNDTVQVAAAVAAYYPEKIDQTVRAASKTVRAFAKAQDLIAVAVKAWNDAALTSTSVSSGSDKFVATLNAARAAELAVCSVTRASDATTKAVGVAEDAETASKLAAERAEKVATDAETSVAAAIAVADKNSGWVTAAEMSEVAKAARAAANQAKDAFCMSQLATNELSKGAALLADLVAYVEALSDGIAKCVARADDVDAIATATAAANALSAASIMLETANCYDGITSSSIAHWRFHAANSSRLSSGPPRTVLRSLPLAVVGYQSVPPSELEVPSSTPCSFLSSSSAAMCTGSGSSGFSAIKRARPAPPSFPTLDGSELLAGLPGAARARCPLPQGYGFSTTTECAPTKPGDEKGSRQGACEWGLLECDMNAATVRALAVYIYSPWGCNVPAAAADTPASGAAPSGATLLGVSAQLPYGAPASKAALSGAEVRAETKATGRLLGMLLDEVHALGRAFPFASAEDAKNMLQSLISGTAQPRVSAAAQFTEAAAKAVTAVRERSPIT